MNVIESVATVLIFMTSPSNDRHTSGGKQQCDAS